MGYRSWFMVSTSGKVRKNLEKSVKNGKVSKNLEKSVKNGKVCKNLEKSRKFSVKEKSKNFTIISKSQEISSKWYDESSVLIRLHKFTPHFSVIFSNSIQTIEYKYISTNRNVSSTVGMIECAARIISII